MSMCDAILMTSHDPWEVARGGETAFAHLMLQAYGPRLAVSSLAGSHIPRGRWIDRPFDRSQIKFLGRGTLRTPANRKPLVPARITNYRLAKASMQAVRELGVYNIFVDSPDLLFAVADYEWQSVCFNFAGVNNPVANSRYGWARIFGSYFDRRMVKALRRINPDVIIAAADERAIEEFSRRIGNVLDRSRIYSFPTRVDTETFCPQPLAHARSELGIAADRTVMAATGRLNWVKGWDLLLDVVVVLKQSIPDIALFFVGDGEDRDQIERRALSLGIGDHVHVTGLVSRERVAAYLNASDVCVVGSHREGWSLAMCEMLACGKPIVATDVSGARDMIRAGENGFILLARDPVQFAARVRAALALRNACSISLGIAQRFSLGSLSKELGAVWNPLSVQGSDGSQEDLRPGRLLRQA